ncbi:phosphoethanolamine transferase [Gellertiella hungarica]|uniref:Lipid A ethanolaminephosphotransferase n=1 Tax=Gellertiella hungarica TaxID=1572859 RepID=A0A7W6J4D5_9HYPH|nr:phosphoethanolamine--lipid A transferase [Gellertiella hungarica]MBB4064542.1 lipid A ethanolaminephosphotransferase [Gellertiella hungarica]
MRIWRPVIGSRTAALLVGIFILATCNRTFWPMLVESFGGFTPVAITFGLSVSLLLLTFFVAISAKYVFKPLAILCLLTAAGASYFTDTFGTIINEQMIDSAMTTNQREAGALISTRFLVHFFLHGILPVLLLLWARVRHETFGTKLRNNSKLIVPMLLATGAMVYLHIGSYIVTIRQNNLMMQTLNPVAPLAAAYNYANTQLTHANVEVQPLGTDAKRGPVATAAQKPLVTILVAGETARGMNFSLNGYDRETNPKLKQLDIVNFTDVTSCGTDTATSLPCMFSVYPRKDYSEGKAKSTQNLLDVFGHAGVATLWWDNNTGSKGIADRTSYVPFMDTKDPVLCPDDECRDTVFLKKLEETLAGVTKDTVIVLHQIGSHGPAYYRRYTETERLFQPDCRTPDLPKCSLEEVRNAYDNSIVATDAFLAAVIDLLKAHDDRISSAMLYASDHGESLGENGIFLHGAPYAFAPKEQTHVPMIAWFSPAYRQLTGLDASCLAKGTANPYSHDKWFHTALGMMNVVTSVYDRDLDIFAACRAKG